MHKGLFKLRGRFNIHMVLRKDKLKRTIFYELKVTVVHPIIK